MGRTKKKLAVAKKTNGLAVAKKTNGSVAETTRLPSEAHYSVIEAAKLLEVVPETIRRRIRSKHLKAVLIGLGYRIGESEIDRIKRDGFPVHAG